MIQENKKVNRIHSGLKSVLISFFMAGLVLMCNPAFRAQRVIFKKDVVEQIMRVYDDSTGPNGRFFNHPFIGFGMILPINETDSVAVTENGKSNAFYAGFREKLKVNNHVAVNLELIYLHQKFHISQNERLNIFAPGITNDVQRFNTNSIGLGFGVRYNYGKRGNVMGRYIDAGADLSYIFANRLFTRNRVDAASNNGAEKVKSSLNNLDFVNPLKAQIYIRAGFNHFAIFARYRANNQFKRSDYFYPIGVVPELPRISLGLEIALYQ